MARRPAGVWTWMLCAVGIAAWDDSATLRAQPRPLPPVPRFESDAPASDALSIPNPLPGTTTRTVLQPTAPPPTPEVVLPNGASVTLPASSNQIIRFEFTARLVKYVSNDESS